MTAYDSPIYIADAALYLMTTQPDLGIKNPYALDDKQFQAAIDLLKEQNAQHRRVLVGLHEGDPGLQERRLGDRHHLADHRNLAQADKAKVEAIAAERGRDRLVGHLDGRDQERAQDLCVQVARPHHLARRRTPQVAEWFGEAPSNSKSCAETADPKHCDTFHADDEAYFDQVWYWTTPIAQCLDGRTDVTCKDYGDWTHGLAGDQGLPA